MIVLETKVFESKSLFLTYEIFSSKYLSLVAKLTCNFLFQRYKR